MKSGKYFSVPFPLPAINCQRHLTPLYTARGAAIIRLIMQSKCAGVRSPDSGLPGPDNLRRYFIVVAEACKCVNSSRFVFARARNTSASGCRLCTSFAHLSPVCNSRPYLLFSEILRCLSYICVTCKFSSFNCATLQIGKDI